MITLNKLIYLTLVACFYRNFKFDKSNCSISTYVQGKVIEFDVSLLSQILGISLDGD